MLSLQVYNTLLQLPLFQGLSKTELAEVVTHTKFDFMKIKAGETIVRENELCNKLYFLLSGTIEVTSFAHNRRYSIRETLPPPTIIQPERMFGLTPYFSKTFTAEEDCSLLTISKNEVLRLSDEFIIFRLNLLNIISTVAQKRSTQPWRNTPTVLRDKIIRFIEQRCLRTAGEKFVKIRMEDLAIEISDSRLNISHEFRRMQQEGLITTSRGMIHVPQMERLLQRN